MDYERAIDLHKYHNAIIYSYLAFDSLPKKYQSIKFHHFLLLLAAKHISQYKAGLFLASDLYIISPYSKSFVFRWLKTLINGGFLAVSSESVFMLSGPGLLAVRAFNRSFHRLYKSGVLPGYINLESNPFAGLTAFNNHLIKTRY